MLGFVGENKCALRIKNGHKNISTTQIYAKITSQKISKDMDLISHKFKAMEEAFIETI